MAVGWGGLALCFCLIFVGRLLRRLSLRRRRVGLGGGGSGKRCIIVIPSLLVWLFSVGLRIGLGMLCLLVIAFEFGLDLVASHLENISSRAARSEVNFMSMILETFVACALRRYY